MAKVITLVLTRQPDHIDSHRTSLSKDEPKRLHFMIEQARYGTLLVFEGAKVTKASLTKSAGVGAADRLDALAAGAFEAPGGWLRLAAEGDLKQIARYTTMERFDHGMISLHVKEEPYRVYWEEHNSVVAELGPTNGNCFRVHGGKSQPEQAILIHAAPNITWLKGCISPRPYGNYRVETDTTYASIRELHTIIGDDRVDMFVTDN